MNLIVAIDGPAASGKSTVSAMVAEAVGAVHVDSGSFYRAATWKCLKSGLADWTEESAMTVLEQTRLDFTVRDGAAVVRVDGAEPGQELRSEAVTAKVSEVAAMPRVRDWVTSRLRAMAGMGSIVMEGRDIGSVVFPDAPHKFFLDATPEERARRRHNETGAAGGISAVAEALNRRDTLDSSRTAAPLTRPADAVAIDTTKIDARQVAALIIRRVKRGTAAAQEPGAWYSVCRLALYGAMKLFFRLEANGVEHVPVCGGCILASNHCSYLDPMAVGCAIGFRHIHFVARRTLASSRLMGWWMKSVGTITIDREKGDMSAMKAIIAMLKQGGLVCLFPEGTRSTDGRLGEAKAGVGFLVARAGVPVVPAFINGTFEAMPKGRTLPRLRKITVSYGRAISPAEVAALGSGGDAYRRIAAAIMERIARLAQEQQAGS